MTKQLKKPKRATKMSRRGDSFITKDIPKWIAACHEVGHAFVAHHHGLEIGEILIWPVNNMWGGKNILLGDLPDNNTTVDVYFGGIVGEEVGWENAKSGIYVRGMFPALDDFVQAHLRVLDSGKPVHRLCNAYVRAREIIHSNLDLFFFNAHQLMKHQRLEALMPVPMAS